MLSFNDSLQTVTRFFQSLWTKTFQFFFLFDENTIQLKIKKILYYSKTKIFYKCIFKIDLNFISNISMSD